jgi:hypothetical protein
MTLAARLLATVASTATMAAGQASKHVCTLRTFEHTVRATYRGVKLPRVGSYGRLWRLVACQGSTTARKASLRAWRRAHDGWAARRHPGWVIPAPIVMCESRGQDEPPNSATASGFYQIISSTWAAYGGLRFAPQAYEATRAEQGVVAARIWNGGRGASQWTCAGIVGY